MKKYVLLSGPIRLEKKEWRIRDDDVVLPYGNRISPCDNIVSPYYHWPALSDVLERAVPHDMLTLEYPEDRRTNDILLPFGFLCRQLGYGGLDREGYSIISEVMNNDPNGFDGLKGLSILEPGYKPSVLAFATTDGMIYFPSPPWVRGNKPEILKKVNKG